MPVGLLNEPLRVPYPPHSDMKVPLLIENTCILLLPVSATYTLPDDGSTAMPSGLLNEPLPTPYLPHSDMKVPLLLENTRILWLAVSATYTLPDDGSTAMPSGPDRRRECSNCVPGVPAPVSLKIGIKESS